LSARGAIAPESTSFSLTGSPRSRLFFHRGLGQPLRAVPRPALVAFLFFWFPRQKEMVHRFFSLMTICRPVPVHAFPPGLPSSLESPSSERVCLPREACPLSVFRPLAPCPACDLFAQQVMDFTGFLSFSVPPAQPRPTHPPRLDHPVVILIGWAGRNRTISQAAPPLLPYFFLTTLCLRRGTLICRQVFQFNLVFSRSQILTCAY